MTAAEGAFDPSTIRAVAFDGYGTVFKFHTEEFRAVLGRVLAEQGLEATDFDAFVRDWYAAYGPAGVWGELYDEGDENVRDGDARPLRGRMPQIQNGPLPEWHSTWEGWRRQFAAAFARHDMDGDPDEASTRVSDALAEATPYPDALDTVEALHRRGLRLGLLSNADEDFLQSSLSHSRLRFSVIQSSESLRAYKPHRSVFEALCHRLHCEPREVLYVGDSFMADVSGARNAGLRSVFVQHSESGIPDGFPEPDITITALGELVALFEGWEP